jgi:hypothetical protein
MNKCAGIYDNYPKEHLLLKFEIVVKAEVEERKKKNKNMPDNIVRHRFMNFLVKLAIDKYISYRK